MKVGVLMGGISSEREVSLKSGEGIIKNLDKNKYEVFPIIINSKKEVIEKVQGLDFVFLALHGEFGEDGSIQALLESIGVNYSGCGVLTSALCMDKKQTKRILKSEGIRVAKDIKINLKNKNSSIEELEELGYPMVVKPNAGGSSIGVSIVRNKEELQKSILEALKYSTEILVEEYLEGEEYTIPVLNGDIFPILLIKSDTEFFDYVSKYADDGATEELVNLPKELQTEFEEIGKRCWDIFNCKAYVRIDIIVSKGLPYVLEINTLPGMTKNSLFPKSAKGANMEYSELLDKIIEYSLV